MRWRRHDDEKADTTKARAELDRSRAQRPEVEAMARQIRDAVVANNFAVNTFDLLNRGKR